MEKCTVSGGAPRKERLLVAAIDFGTTFSGYAFSFRDEFDRDPLHISTNQTWTAGTQSLMSLKTPTIVLLNPDKEFHSFGFEAENKYSDLAAENMHENWYYFRRFKMLLHKEKGLKRNMELTDATRKQLPAKTVFSLSIRYLKNHLLGRVCDRANDINEDDIHWVVSVPAIWNDSAKQFMREVAVEAGIADGQLSIALEPEAASIYCQHLKTEKADEQSHVGLAVSKPGTKYMVADLGGGTADITVHERQADGTLMELEGASGGPWGGTAVDEAFMQFLENIVEFKAMQQFQMEYMEDYVDLCREFETKKRTIVAGGKERVTFNVPGALRECFEQHGEGKTIKSVIEKNSSLVGKVTWDRNKMRVDADLVTDFFRPTINKIVNHIAGIFDKPGMSEVKYILMVGGFSDCRLVQDAIKQAFHDKRVIIPTDAGLSVLKGAVLFGHTPCAISARISRFTYGTQNWPEFIEGVHPKEKKKILNGVARCKDVFHQYVGVGSCVQIGQSVSQVFAALNTNQDCLFCNVYASTEESPKFTTDSSCHRVGTLTVPLPPADSGISREVEEIIIFGNTELGIEARDRATGKVYRAFFDFL